MKIKLTLIIFLSFVLITVKSEEYYSKSITTRNGLAQNDVHKIIQDSKKFIWIATNDGLNRFDGYDFKTYNKGYNGLQSNLIVSISEDKNKNIWVCTADKGLFMYNRLLDKFIHLSEMSDLTNSKLPQKITRMLIDNTNNSIWVYESKAGIYKIQMNKKYNKVLYIQNFEAITKNINNLIVRIFHSDKNGRVWIGTNKGLYFYDIKNNKFQKIKAVGESIISIKDIKKEKLGVLCSDKIVILV
jgi:ligand-binding sensor domain-containing protein